MSIFQTLWDALGLGFAADEADYDGEGDDDAIAHPSWQEDQMPPQVSPATPLSSTNGPHNGLHNGPHNVIGLPGRGQTQAEVLLVEPRSFDEVPNVVTALKERKAVILNLSLMDADMAQRCVDFVAGGAFAIDGHQQRIGETIFLFTPSFVQISSYNPATPAAPYPVATHSPKPHPSIWSGANVPLVQ